MLIRGTRQRLGRNELPKKFLSRVTHLSLNGKRIGSLDGLDLCPNLKVLYLYENELDDVGRDLMFATGLTHLYLQSNKLAVIPSSALAALGSTLKLVWLDGNRIEVSAGCHEASHWNHPGRSNRGCHGDASRF